MARKLALVWNAFADRLTEIHRIYKTRMNTKLIVSLVAACATLLPGLGLSQQFDRSFSKRLYIGIGAGQSTLEPDTSDVPTISLLDDNDTAGILTLGFDFSRRLTAELQYAELGTAELTGGDGIEYAETSISGLYYLWNGLAGSPSEYLDRDGLDRRAGLSLYGRAGIGKIDNDAVGTVQFERDNDIQLLVGLGLEYALDFGLGVRAEFIRFDTDASYAGGSLIYRFGGTGRSIGTTPNEQPTSLPTPEPELPVLPAPPPIETLPPPPPPPPQFAQQVEPSFEDANDSDSDGVTNSFDECGDTPAGTPVGSNGCALFKGALEGVNFLTSSDTLTESARVALDEVVDTLNAFADIRISIEAHTDSLGGDAANLRLSRQRAIAVARYLTAQGIPVERLEARAFGETQPIADNDTRAGRLLNRRVEFRTIP